MTYPPHDPATSAPSAQPAGPWPGYGAPALPAEAGPDPAKRRTRRRIAIGATVAGALVVGGGGYAVASYLSGAGPQPEDVLPADTVGFVKLDLDPAAGQKLAVQDLLEKFPALGDGTDDVREDLVDGLLEQTGADLDYATDVEPWLGDRMAVAAVPDDGSEAGVSPVLVLAVTDQQAMADTLRGLGDEVGYAVRDDFVLITEQQATADRLAADESSLSDDADYAGDLDALDGDQLAVAWADLSAAQALIGENLPQGSAGMFGGSDLSGRVVVGLHADDDALELVGMDFSVSDTGPGPRSTTPTELVRHLPEDTVGAVSLGGAGEAAVTAYGDLVDSGALAGMEEQLTSLGLDLPDDLRAVLGTDLVVAAFGDVQNPGFGARVSTDQPEEAVAALGRLAQDPELALPLTPSPVDGGYVLASDPDVLAALTGDGDLGSTEAFEAAVPDAEDATAIGYADLAAIVAQVPDSGDQGVQPSDFAAARALGFSVTPTDEGSRFVLRITTR